MLCQNKTLNKKPLAKNEPQSVKKCLYTRMHEIIYAHTSVHKFFLRKSVITDVCPSIVKNCLP